jgi:hypothetical protein
VSWLAEIMRKQHRECARCGLGPTHLYDPVPSAGDAGDRSESDPTGTPLCGACLEKRMAQDFSRFEGRCLVFEPTLGPDALTFHDLEDEKGAAWPIEHRATARACLDRMASECAGCREAGGRFLWVPVEADANLWTEDWLARLHDGALSPTDTLCGRCAASRLTRSFEERGLCLEAIVPPGRGDGMLLGSEFY